MDQAEEPGRGPARLAEHSVERRHEGAHVSRRQQGIRAAERGHRRFRQLPAEASRTPREADHRAAGIVTARVVPTAIFHRDRP